eukprot:TRINITY_DN96096_c0_g1_i1.p1 TRINITY_DN96096_c0_g1~~TRINITY_DN96096_c0_g1_i1.p1  ORF type:complete len:399 (-),score=71.23 TRINITY_DN96096_c0_g1_i1:49-1245(-)
MQVNDVLCRCICGSSLQEESEEKGFGSISGSGAISSLELPEMSEVSGLLSYRAETDLPLRGKPIREGSLWHLSAEESGAREVHASLFVNGLSFVSLSKQASVAFSPFTLVRNCKFQASFATSAEFADFKIFKVALYAQGQCYYFASRAADPAEGEEERSKWVLDISTAIRLVTQSLFPPFQISCRPVVSVASTYTRLMAGYLLHSDGHSLVSVLYCELHAHRGDQALLILYENEGCEVPVVDVVITDDSPCVEKVGINCSCFCVGNHDLSSRTLSERKLWMRAISNLKVKLANKAPSPDDEEIENYREAVMDHLHTIRSSLHCQMRTDALLPASDFNTFQSELTPFSMSLWASLNGNSPDSPESQKLPTPEVSRDSDAKAHEDDTLRSSEVQMQLEGL